jgi:hypothetical protein
MFFVLERFDLGRLVLLVNAPFAAIAIDIGEFVYCDCVPFIQSCAM